jgi:hypothetical protein
VLRILWGVNFLGGIHFWGVSFLGGQNVGGSKCWGIKILVVQLDKSGISQKLCIGSYSNLKLKLSRPKQSVQILQMKTTSHGRRPQNIKSGTSQQPLDRSYSNFKLKL